jgi:hypothetical protein
VASKITIRNGEAIGVYDDRLRPLFEAMGPIKVKRATTVEFEEESGDWVAVLLNEDGSPGKEIARGRLRDKVIEEEVAWLEKEVIR